MWCEAQEGKNGRSREWEWRKRWIFGIGGGQCAAPKGMVRYEVKPGRTADWILRQKMGQVQKIDSKKEKEKEKEEDCGRDVA